MSARCKNVADIFILRITEGDFTPLSIPHKVVGENLLEMKINKVSNLILQTLDNLLIAT